MRGLRTWGRNYEAWESTRPRRLVLDLREVTYADGAVLGHLLDILDDGRQDEWLGVIVGPAQDVFRLPAVVRVTHHRAFRLPLGYQDDRSPAASTTRLSRQMDGGG